MISLEESVGYADGKFCPLKDLSLSILDLGVIHCDSTYDVCHVFDGNFFRLDWHLDRFFNSARGLKLEIPLSRIEVERVLSECVKRSGLRNAFVWMVCTRGVPVTGNPRDLDSCKPRFLAYAKPYYAIKVGAPSNQPVKIIVSSRVRFPKVSMDQSLKSWHWGDLTAAQFEAKERSADTAVLVDLDGHLTEGPGFNIFWVKNGTVLTPKSGMLEGITRKVMLALCKEEKIPTELRNPPPKELVTAEEIFLTSTSGGITPVSHFEGKEILTHSKNSLTNRLSDLYWKKHSDRGWITPIKY